MDWRNKNSIEKELWILSFEYMINFSKERQLNPLNYTDDAFYFAEKVVHKYREFYKKKKKRGKIYSFIVKKLSAFCLR